MIDLIALEALAVVSVLVAAAWAAERLLARRAAARAALWQAALVGVLLTPPLALVGRWLPWRVGVIAPPSAAVPTERIATESASGPPATPPAATTRTPEQAPRAAAPIVVPTPALPTAPSAYPETLPMPEPSRITLPSLTRLAFMTWGVGSAFLLARLLHGAFRLRRLRLQEQPLCHDRHAEELAAAARALGVERLPDVSLSPGVRGPVVAGLFRPRVVLPDGLPERCASHELVAALVHECAHVLRGDPALRLLQRLATALFWFHPLVHLLNRRLDLAREQVCDNHVLAFLDPPCYAEALLSLARMCHTSPLLEGHLTMMPRHYRLERRVADLLDGERDTATRPPAAHRAILSLSLALVAVAATSFGLSGAAPADEKAGPTVKLKGQVRDADGNPAAGAAVWAMASASGPPQVAEATTDANGRYSLALRPGQWYVWASHGTQGGKTPERVTVSAGATPTETPIRMENRGRLRGRLLEAESGKPIAGGRLHLDVGKALLADKDGRFEMGGLSRTHHEAFVLAPGRARVRVLFDTTGKFDTELDIPVPRGGKVVGRVTDLDGKPVAGAYVGRSTSGTTFSIRALMTACGKDGRFEYDGTSATEGQVTLEAYAPGFAGEEMKAAFPSGGKPAAIDFRLRPQAGKDKSADAEKLREVSGVVTRPDGKPAAGVLVRWGYQPYSGAAETRTDEKGRFRLDVPDKENWLAVLPATFQPEFPKVAEGGKKEVAVKLREGKVARGVVRDEAGKPLANVQVIAQTGNPDPRWANPFWLRESAATTDQLGRFEVRGVPPAALFDFLRRDLSDSRQVCLDFETDNEVKMRFGGAISGRVVDKDGKPIRSFRVTLGFVRDRKPDDRTEGYFAGYSGIGVRFTSDDGTFVLTGVGADCVFRVKVLAEGHGEAVGERVFSLPINRVANATPTTLRAGPPVKFRVRAVTPDGQPIAGAKVTLIDGQEQYDKEYTWAGGGWEDSASAKSAADGWADFPSLTFSAATLIVRAPGHGRYRVGWRKKEKEMVAVLEKEAVFSGEVLDAKGAPVRNCYVVMTRDGDRLAATIDPDSKGRFRVEELPPGEWQVVVTGEDGLTSLHRERVTLKAGEAKEMKFRLKK